jgi:hypothetical protein
VLSNAHVLALDGRARVGDPIVDEQGRIVARLHATVRFAHGASHVADAAVARLANGTRPVASGRMFLARAQANDIVWKQGATTGRTFGRVVSLDYSIAVRMGFGTLTFRHQMVVAPIGSRHFSLPGDSGSVIRDCHLPEAATGPYVREPPARRLPRPPSSDRIAGAAHRASRHSDSVLGPTSPAGSMRPSSPAWVQQNPRWRRSRTSSRSSTTRLETCDTSFARGCSTRMRIVG